MTSRRPALLLALLLALSCGPGAATAETPRAAGIAAPPPRARCPVCGMFLEPYPEWWAEAVFADGGRALFDGVKDLVRFLADRGRYAPERAGGAPRLVRVTDYYTLAALAAESAFYVVGSDVLGPMGREYVPFATREAAEEFARDHRGTGVLVFRELAGHPLE